MGDLKIIIPMAGRGKRLEPLTLHRPKPLLRVADKRLLDHVLETFKPLERSHTVEYIFIVGHLGDQIREYMRETYPGRRVTWYVQEQLMGQSSAVHLAREAIHGPCLLTFCDTINRIDFSFLPLRSVDAAATVREVEDPRRFGVAALGSDDLITKLIEKPQTGEHRSALTGIYYFSEGRKLMQGIEAQLARGVALGNEYYLADAINILLQEGMHVRAVKSGEWLDAGTPNDLLQTNARLLRLGHGTSTTLKVPPSTRLIPPVHIHASSRVEGCTVGPNVAIGRNCSIRGSTLKNSIVDDDSKIIGSVLEDSLVGKGCIISGGIHHGILGDRECIAAAPVAGVN